MSYGSGFGISAGSSFYQKRGYYEPGSMYKRFQLTNAQKMNRQAVRAYDARVASTGPLIFSRLAAASEQKSILVVLQLHERLTETLKSRGLDIRV